MSEPIRILQVFAQMNRGGAETMIMNLYRNIDRKKIQFDFVVHTEEVCTFDEEIRELGGKIYRVPRYIGKNHFAYKKSWENLFKTHPKYKIIHGHVRSTASIYLKVAKKHGITTIAHSHNTSSGKGIQALVKNLLQYPIRFNADYMIACSKDAGKWLFGEKAIKSEKFLILKNAIEIDKFMFDQNIRINIRKELNLDGKYVVGHVGRFHPQKNHEFVIDVFNTFKKENNNAVLILVGEGPNRRNVQNKVEKLGLSDSVIFLGVRSDVNEIFQGMDVLLFPSRYEGLGIVIIEAQATGLQSIVSENIPDEAIITDLVTKLPLELPTDKWVEFMLRSKNDKEINRQKYHELIKMNGYEVKSTALELERFYLSC